ncbi:MAG: M23 family metallopeptidase [Vicinamibacteria bacterium]|nr:M23 family metallopeptidase [Vicinamibacteria bacterium]
MKWSSRDVRTVDQELRLGFLGGLVLLLACLMAARPFDARAQARPAPRDVVPAVAEGMKPPPASPERSAADLAFPVPAVSLAAMFDSFKDPRGLRAHHAVDILAPRRSDIVAVTDGTIARLLSSVAGGIGVYQFSADRKYCYYYAHLQSYALHLREGQQIKRGQILGYVGTTGNAPAHTPHLHFAITRLRKPNQWWGGEAIDPFPILKREVSSGH